MNAVKRTVLLVCILCNRWSLLAQPLLPEEHFDTSPSVLGITVLGNPGLTFSSVDNYTNGVSANHNTLRLSVSLGLSWTLQIRVTDDLRYQNYSIPASAIGVQMVSLTQRPELFLNTANQTLTSGIATSLLDLLATIRYRATGGSAFLKPGGTYTTTLVFTYSAN
ncbi:hypothetical protein [Spirosoma gilvum]